MQQEKEKENNDDNDDDDKEGVESKSQTTKRKSSLTNDEKANELTPTYPHQYSGSIDYGIAITGDDEVAVVTTRNAELHFGGFNALSRKLCYKRFQLADMPVKASTNGKPSTMAAAAGVGAIPTSVNTLQGSGQLKSPPESQVVSDAILATHVLSQTIIIF